MKETPITQLLANMPAIMAMVTELNTLLNNMPKEGGNDLTITMGKSSIRVNRKNDEDTYINLINTINETSISKISKLREQINTLLNPSRDGMLEAKSA